MRIVFMGTPDFAVASLEALLSAGKNVVGVITAPDKPAGRGHKLQQSAVKKCALRNGLPLLQPTNLKDESFVAQLREWQADFQVVVAFRMLPEVVWNMPSKGTMNLHGSLLPQYRGAAPINRAVMNGETETGVTTFLLQHKIDTGNILLSRSTPVGPDETAGDIHDRLMAIGAELVVETVTAIENDDYTTVPQDQLANQPLKEAPKIFREDCKIDWNTAATDVWNHIRGLLPFPAPWTQLIAPDGKRYDVKIREAARNTEHGNQPGKITVTPEKNLWADTANGTVTILQMQLPGKRTMTIEEIINGYGLNAEWRFE